ncbi:MAG: chorismate synthase, partial [Treponema sp.]|nr:chorismate synthase [Treponema sp.]
GGIVECVVSGVPAGLGEPVFDKADALLAQAMLSIGAIKGIEFGAGFASGDLTGSVNNDPMRKGGVFVSNNAGGILGGITRGDDIVFRVAVKPVPSIFIKQQTVDASLNECDILIEGRHDVCLCPRIVPVVQAMTAITLADLLLRNLSSKTK